MQLQESSQIQPKQHEGNVIQRIKNTKEKALEGEITQAKYGEESDNVKRIQEVLIKMNYWTGYSSDVPTGYFGDTTRDSLIYFQTGYLKLDEKELYNENGNYVGCGPITAQHLNTSYELLNDPTVPEYVKNGIMGVGKSGERNKAYSWDIKAGKYNGYVKEAQEMLLKLEYKLPNYGADGKWSKGGEAYNALLKFQKYGKNAFTSVQNGNAENQKQFEHFRGVEFTGKLDKSTYTALQKEVNNKTSIRIKNDKKTPKKIKENIIKKIVEDTKSLAEKSDQGTGNSSQITYTQLNTNNIRPAVLDKINHYIDKIKTMNDTETCWEQLCKCNVKWTRADYERALDNLLSDLTSPTGAAIENVLNRTSSVITGSLQFIGGLTEAGTGASIAAGASWTGVGIPIGIAGGYMAIDGASNVSGGASKVVNALFGSNQGDTLNFMKNAYISISPGYGENIYNATQIGIGLFTIGKGLTELPADAVSVYARPKNISRANVEGLSTKTIAIDAGDQIVLTTKTDSGMILQKTIIDKSKLANGTLLIGVDTFNASGSASSIKQK